MASFLEKLKSDIKRSFLLKVATNFFLSLKNLLLHSLICCLILSFLDSLIKLFSWVDIKWVKLTSSFSILERNSKFLRLLFSPLFLPFLIFLFFSLSSVKLTKEALTVIFSGIVAFLLGTKIGGRIFQKMKVREVGKFLLSSFILLYLFSLSSLLYLLWAVGGIPLFQPGLRGYLYKYVRFTYLAWTIIPSSLFILCFYGNKYSVNSNSKIRVSLGFFFLVNLILVSFLGFRTGVLAEAIGGIFVLYLTGTLRFIDILLPALMGGTVYVAVSSVRWGVANPLLLLTLIFSRSTITTYNLELILKRVGFNGYTRGAVQYSAITSVIKFLPGPRIGPRSIITNLIGAEAGVTSTCTIYGQFLADFGLSGILLEFLLMGLVISIIHSKVNEGKVIPIFSYSVFMSYFVPGIETGILDFNVYIYLFISITLFLCSLKRRV